jgi:hypothetical protein
MMLADTGSAPAGRRCPDLAAALDWADRCPTARTGTVEVRPVLPMPT